ncbi:peroxiredoxin family protein [Flavobacterium sp. F52]|uniref:peroxiredoxin family protein n=1 Tax=Flavobacterium sp. F52 TaxID=1202532 RepID=UPI000272E7A8|nr:redoxin domain-containing protein [Flavobacterium sp. F52]EJG01345.1 alkyl hydroperoxide reductase [Flavobacterium sp. F52]
MRKSLKKIFVLLFSIIFLFLGHQIITKLNYKKEVQNNIKVIPEFSYLNINGKDFTNEDLKKSIPALFIYFNSECEYCNEEAQMVNNNIGKFKDIQIVFISSENSNQIKEFAQKFKLNHYDNLHFLHDSKTTFASTFDVNTLPCLVLYDKDKKLIEKIKGQTKPEILIKKLKIE